MRDGAASFTQPKGTNFSPLAHAHKTCTTCTFSYSLSQLSISKTKKTPFERGLVLESFAKNVSTDSLHLRLQCRFDKSEKLRA